MFFILLYICSFWVLSSIIRGKNYFRIQKNICFILLLIFFGLRDLPVLNDTGHYYEEFLYVISDHKYLSSSIFNIDAIKRFEPGFQVFEKLIAKYISEEPYSIIFISSLISTIVIIKLVRHFTNNIALAIFLLLGTSTIFYYYNNIRQSFACYFFWLGLSIIQRVYDSSKLKCYILSLLIYGLAISFHYSAIVLIIPLLIFRMPLTKRNVFLVISIGIFFSFSTYYLMQGLGLSDIEYYERGLNRETTSLGPILNSCLQISFAILSYLLSSRYLIKAKYPAIWWLVILSCIFSVASVSNGIIGRFSMYFSIFTILHFIYCIERVPLYSSCRISRIVCVILLIRVSILLEYRPEWNHLYPYGFFDFSQPVHDYRIYSE